MRSPVPPLAAFACAWLASTAFLDAQVAPAPLNLGFESGSLDSWTATGEAFAKQPIKGDTVTKRRGDMKSEHVGEFWIGSFEVQQSDAATGTLISAPIRVTQPWASFLVAGGDLPGTRVEIVDAADSKVIHIARGSQSENLRRSIVDLRKLVGRDIQVRLVDQEKGHWGHINFDDFVFHAAEPKFAQVAAGTLKGDDVKYAGLAPLEAAKAAVIPRGFGLTVFAAEPAVVNPVSFCIDDRGRLWVVEGMTYPTRAKEGEGKDRILILEDQNGDGVSDKRTVFMENLNLVSGIEVGFGGVWLGAAPYLSFIPINEEGDVPKPAGEPQVLLDGWGYQDTHETLNTFRWGPDGWLYGCHGVFTHSKVGRPGTREAERQKLNAGFWRFHPQKHVFEVFAEGTSNPWGIDFDANGQLFAEACVIPHLFHVIQGARYQRQAGQHFNVHSYDDIKTIADHRHYLGANPHGGNGKSDSAGGGHAHAGLMIYQGDVWPQEWRGRVLMGNIHGQRINADIPVRSGSGFIGKHGEDFLNFNDRASQVVDIRQGPDSSMFMIDWYDMNQCHRVQREAHDYTTGRIYRVASLAGVVGAGDLGRLPDDELAKFCLSTDAHARTHARRILQERKTPLEAINEVLQRANSDAQYLYVLWTKHAIGAATDEVLAASMKSTSEYERAWAIQFAAEDREVSEPLRSEMARLAREDASKVVRLYLTSAAQRLPVPQRLAILEPLLAREDNAKDHNLPLMLWYALEPVVGANPADAVTLLTKTKIPLLQEYITRRMAATADAASPDDTQRVAR